MYRHYWRPPVVDGEVIREYAVSVGKEALSLSEALNRLSDPDPSRRKKAASTADSGRMSADQLVGLLADYSYSSLRFYGHDGVSDLQRDAD